MRGSGFRGGDLRRHTEEGAERNEGGGERFREDIPVHDDGRVFGTCTDTNWGSQVV